jgi:hypothetical protein
MAAAAVRASGEHGSERAKAALPLRNDGSRVSISDALLLPFSDALPRRLVLDREATPTRGKSRLGNVALAFKSLSIFGPYFLLAVGDLLNGFSDAA